MKKYLGLSLLLAFAAPASAGELSVAATPVPHAQILEFVKPMLAEQGVNLNIRVFTDYVQPNLQVAQDNIDANFFQHQPYLDEFNKSRGTDLISIAKIHIEPFAAYSLKIKDLSDLPQDASVAIPNDATNGGRALLLLDKAGVIRLKDNSNIAATPRDIVDNPKNIKVRELEAATLPRVLNQVDLALINTNYALEAGLNPLTDALAIEGSDSPYVNILVVSNKGKAKDSDDMQALVKALTSIDTKLFIEREYKGAVIPVFATDAASVEAEIILKPE